MRTLFAQAGLVAFAAAAVAGSFPAFAADVPDSVRAAYDNSHTLATNIAGITMFRGAPAGFNVLTATDEALATYGYPPRPDAISNPRGYAKWARAMQHATQHWTGQLKAKSAYSMNLKPGPRADQAKGGDVAYNSYNWSGIATTNTLTKWNKKSSFYYVISDFNVPVAQQTPGTCDGGWDLEVSWNGIDGFSNGDVLQGGSLSEAYCSGGTTAADYLAWVEWYPSYSIIGEFYINPGDDVYVETWDTSSTNGYVFVEDETLGIYTTVNLVPTEGPYLVGNSADYIVERPCCSNGNYYPLADYVQNFWAENEAVTFAGIVSYPGSNNTHTALISMLDDAADQNISTVQALGTTGLFFYAEGCSASGGCTP